MTIIALTPVTSSQIEAIGYDEPSQTLAIKFKSGGLYHYSNFTKEDWLSFASAESIGSHFYKNIKHNAAKYPYQKQ
jgi:KTSC domain